MLVNVTIPVFNEELRLGAAIPKLLGFLREHCPFEVEIVIADNASTDRTLDVAMSFREIHKQIRVTHLDAKGRGRIIRKVWGESDADVLTYMDVDLSTDLSAFPLLIQAVTAGGYDLAVGSRRLQPALTTRGLKREIISQCYVFLVQCLFRTRFSDPQCGFKAITRMAARRLLPLVEDNGWFMDTEILVLAEYFGYRIYDLAVKWVDNPDSRVNILATSLSQLRGLIRLRNRLRSLSAAKCLTRA